MNTTRPEVLDAAVSAAHHIHGPALGGGAEDRSEVLARIVEATGIPDADLRRAIALAPVDVPPLAHGRQDPFDYLRALSGVSRHELS